MLFFFQYFSTQHQTVSELCFILGPQYSVQLILCLRPNREQDNVNEVKEVDFLFEKLN